MPIKMGFFWSYLKFFTIVDTSLIKTNTDWLCMDLHDTLT